jgi:hypothetical protein
MTTTIDTLSWGWIALALVVPPLAGLVAALPFWRRRQPIFGNIVATVIIFGSGMALILREYVELDAITRQCLEAGAVCWPEPSAFARFAIDAFIALVEVFGVFTLSLFVEERVRRRDYSPEWR